MRNLRSELYLGLCMEIERVREKQTAKAMCKMIDETFKKKICIKSDGIAEPIGQAADE